MNGKAFPMYESWQMLFGRDRATGEIAEDAAELDDVQAEPVETLNPDDLFDDYYTPSFANGDPAFVDISTSAGTPTSFANPPTPRTNVNSPAMNGVPERPKKKAKDFDANRAKQAEEVENYEDSSSPKENYPKGSFIAFTLKSLSAGEAEEMVLECVNGDEEIPGENIDEGQHPILEPSAKEMSRPFASSNSELYGTNLLGYQDTGKYSPSPHCVEFIDFKIGADSGYIQFEEPEAAQKAHADEYGLAVKNFIATLDPVTGRQQLQHSVTPSDI
ncbi:hypothetical protein RHGRI_006291 [Rhododendron griersonianum]|uniref:Uncharacterized protein n=1 Tax=Rhododendron griersonianum TaxID=479676 RepID=A0AAV6KSI8_9ERIC|nr:hypothetical protein RHGRI_006291 [Rhododendron griersonianum]